MATGEQFRLAQRYDTAYLEFQHIWRFLVEEVLNDDIVPVDLSAFDSIKLQFYLADDDPSLVDEVTCVVLTDDADREPPTAGGTAARCEGTWDALATNGFTEAEHRAKLVGITGTDTVIFDKPWLFTIFLGGPKTTV